MNYNIPKGYWRMRTFNANGNLMKTEHWGSKELAVDIAEARLIHHIDRCIDVFDSPNHLPVVNARRCVHIIIEPVREEI